MARFGFLVFYSSSIPREKSQKILLLLWKIIIFLTLVHLLGLWQGVIAGTKWAIPSRQYHSILSTYDNISYHINFILSVFWVMQWHVCMLYFLITSIMQTRMQEAFIIIFIFTFNIAMKKTWLFSNEVLCKCVWERGVPQSHDCHWEIKWLYNNIVYSSIPCTIPCTTSHNDFVFQFCFHTSSSNQHWIALMISSCQLLGTSTQTLTKKSY